MKIFEISNDTKMKIVKSKLMKVPQKKGSHDSTKDPTAYDYDYLKYDLPDIEDNSISFRFSDYIRSNCIIFYGYKNKNNGNIKYTTKERLNKMSKEEIQKVFGPSKLVSLAIAEIKCVNVKKKVYESIILEFDNGKVKETDVFSTPLEFFK